MPIFCSNPIYLSHPIYPLSQFCKVQQDWLSLFQNAMYLKYVWLISDVERVLLHMHPVRAWHLSSIRHTFASMSLKLRHQKWDICTLWFLGLSYDSWISLHPSSLRLSDSDPMIITQKVTTQWLIYIQMTTHRMSYLLDNFCTLLNF